ncbi:alanine racemase [Actinomadura litoris]|uniref:alanine racemase n=1 Tax=Actinomadura litoris TaxID=2678616 RepID=UPI001FA79974|nr:alanine racemase [Actinomadura litoris]
MRVSAEARVDLDAIGDNIGLLRERAGGAEVMAMVKAEAYGHGLVEAGRAAVAGGATWLGVAKLAEALRLREAGVDVRTLVCLGVPGEPYEEAVARDVDLAVGAVWMVEEVVEAAERAGRPARIHLKADTGMSRGGAGERDWAALVDAALKAEASGHLRAVGIMSHFACADEPGHPSIAAQLDAFGAMTRHAERVGARFEVRHIANSAAALTLPESRFDIVRPGIAAYGLTPMPSAGTFGLRPAMTLVASAALVKRVSAGSGVSYGHTYVTERETTLALVPAGYGDGIPRHGSNLLEVFAAGRRRTIAGRVCMDQFVIDLGDDDMAPGDEIVLFGPGDQGEPTAQDWADALGTISYEIVTRIGIRVPRAYSGRAV